MEKLFHRKICPIKAQQIPRVDIISEYRPFLRILKAFNIDNYRNNDRHIFWNNLLILLFTITLATAEILEFVLGVWHFFDHGFILRKIANALPLLISSVQVLSSYATLSMKNHEIQRVLDNLQETIDKRCEKSIGSFRLYQRMQAINVKIVDFLVKVALLVIVSLYTAAATFPISYAVFDYPPPELWTLALDTQLV